MLALHAATNPGFIPGTTYGPRTLLGAIPEHRPGVIPNHHQLCTPPSYKRIKSQARKRELLGYNLLFFFWSHKIHLKLQRTQLRFTFGFYPKFLKLKTPINLFAWVQWEILFIIAQRWGQSQKDNIVTNNIDNVIYNVVGKLLALHTYNLNLIFNLTDVTPEWLRATSELKHY